jgi:hypothetical protein
MINSESIRIANPKNVAETWDDAHRYSPAPRHRRRMIMNILSKLQFSDCMDAGCAQPFLLAEIVKRFGVKGYGCDMSDKVMATNRRIAPHCEFQELDLSRETWPGGRQFDLIISTEVLEHIPEWRSALANIASMTRRNLVITLPSGPRLTMDRLVGHHQHFQGPEIVEELRRHGFVKIKAWHWGFPFHSLYKYLINRVEPEKLYESFGQSSYTFSKRLISNILFLLFFLNAPFNRGCQLFVVAQKENADAR